MAAPVSGSWVRVKPAVGNGGGAVMGLFFDEDSQQSKWNELMNNLDSYAYFHCTESQKNKNIK